MSHKTHREIKCQRYEIIGKFIPTLSGFTRCQGVNLCFGGDPDLEAAILQATITLKLFAGVCRLSLAILGGSALRSLLCELLSVKIEFGF